MSTIDVSNLTFSYDGTYENIFENVSFRIDTNWKLGLTGRNGRGKTTLLKLLMNEYEYSGTIAHNIEFEYFPFKISDKTQNSLEIIKQKSLIDDYDYWKIEKEFSLLDLDEELLYRPFITLSGGEQVKVLLVSLFLKDNCFLLIDEPTNHLDSKAREIVSDYLKSKKGFILISHDRKFLDNCIDHILSINKINIEIQKGNFTSWYENKKNQDNFEINKNQKLQKDIERLKDSAKQNSNWSNKTEKSKNGTRIGGLRPDKGRIGHKAAKMMKRAKSLEARQQSAIEEKSKLLKNIESIESLKIKPLKHHSKQLLNLDSTSLYYSDKKICSNVSFEINQGDRISLCGKNGCGKSTILKFINGDDKIISEGKFIKASNLKISYISQDTSHLNGRLSEFAKIKNIDESLFKTILHKLDFSRTQFEKDISNFSEGQKKKVLIAGSLCESAHLYLWDEPLNFIDILSRIQIEELILQFKPTILFVEHDQMFTETISTKIKIISSR